ncbi:uncharacterized protein [Phyllobates terribilis]|uniref:uncharacterized protein n=1 Tax=Phyllobates terribilis TaxID=111132 RepID=UPI003CCB1D78
MWWRLCRWRSLQYRILSVKIFYIKRIFLNHLSRMDMDRDKMAERILHLTLEILFRLTGEDYTVVKKTSSDRYQDPVSEGWGRPLSSITGPPPHPLIHEDINDQKILELAYKMIELLTGEVPIRCQDVTVYFSMEEWEYLEGHKDLYKDIMMEVPQPLTSPDISSKRTTPERCPRPLLPQDCKQEDPNVPQDHQIKVDKNTSLLVEMDNEIEKIEKVMHKDMSTKNLEKCQKDTQKDLEKWEHNISQDPFLAIKDVHFFARKLILKKLHHKTNNEEIFTTKEEIEALCILESLAEETTTIAPEMELINILERSYQEGMIPKKMADVIKELNPRLPTLYLTPKIHKDPMDPPGKPIVAGSGGLCDLIGQTIDYF